jgi:hypothetical protein
MKACRLEVVVVRRAELVTARWRSASFEGQHENGGRCMDNNNCIVECIDCRDSSRRDLRSGTAQV